MMIGPLQTGSAFRTGHCPECDGIEFIHGPRGGAARNYGCTGCGAWFNLTIWEGEVAFWQTLPPAPWINPTWPRGPLPIGKPPPLAS
jgi:hypothetical protein